MNSPDRNNAIKGHRNMSKEYFIACEAENKTTLRKQHPKQKEMHLQIISL